MLDGNDICAKLIQILIIVSLIAFSLETIPDLTPQQKMILQLIELFTITVFTVEYFLRIYSYKEPLKFITSGWGIIDALAIFPYYLFVGVDLRAARIFRLLRLSPCPPVLSLPLCHERVAKKWMLLNRQKRLHHLQVLS